MPHKIEYYGFCDQSKTLHIETRDCKNWVPQLDEPVEPCVVEAHAPATPATPTVGLQVAIKSLLAMCRAVYKTYAESNSEHELPGALGRTFYENIQFAGETLKGYYDSAVAEAAPTTPDGWVSVEERLPEEDGPSVMIFIDSEKMNEWAEEDSANARFQDDNFSGPMDIWNVVAVNHWAREAKWLTHWRYLPSNPGAGQGRKP